MSEFTGTPLPKLNLNLSRTDTHITTDSNVFEKETNKISEVGTFRKKKYWIQCDGNGTMKFTTLKDPAKKLEDLFKLKEKGVLTEEEFAQLKSKLLKDMT